MKRVTRGRTVRNATLSTLLSAALLVTGVPIAAAEELAGQVEQEARVSEAPAGQEPVQVTGTAPLEGEGSRVTLGVIVSDGLEYAVNPDGESVALVGCTDAAEPADVAVPSEVTSGADTYAVTKVNFFGGGSILR